MSTVPLYKITKYSTLDFPISGSPLLHSSILLPLFTLVYLLRKSKSNHVCHDTEEASHLIFIMGIKFKREATPCLSIREDMRRHDFIFNQISMTRAYKNDLQYKTLWSVFRINHKPISVHFLNKYM